MDCEQWTADSLSAPPVDSTPEPETEDITPDAAEEPAPATRSPALAALAAAASAAATAPAPPFPAPAKRPSMLVLVGGAVAIAGVLLLALVMFRGSSTANVAAAPVAAAGAKPAAVAPRRTTVPAAAAAAAKWSTENRAVWVGKRRNAAAFEVMAENMVAVWMKQVRPMLVVRCLSNSTDVFVFTASALQMEPHTEDHTVTFSFDDGPATSEQWPDGAEHDALFAPDGAAFAARLSRAHTLRFGYTPHNARPVTATFHVRGLAELMAPIARECGSQK